MTKRSLPVNYIFILVFLSGFSFLVYEVSWFRLLSLVLGATVSASTIVLVAFMAGFGLGAWYWGKTAGLRFTPIHLLSGLLLSIGVIGFLSHYLLSQGIPGLYTLFAGSGISASIPELIVWIVALILLLIPAFFMGGILPVASGLLIRNNSKIASLLGHVYAWETIGSTLGGLATGFFLIRAFGQQNTVFIAAGINILTALPLLLWFTQPKTIEEYPFESEKLSSSKKQVTIWPISDQSLNRYAAVLGTFIFGFTVIGLQVAWFRIFRIYMTNTSYTFSLIASMVILGLFSGSLYFSAKGEKRVNPKTMLNLLLITAGVVFIGFGILIKLPELIMFPLTGDKDAYFLRIIVIPIISALLVILPVTFLSGYAFPLACSLYTSSYNEVSRSIGRILLFNTAGSILGPLLTAFLLIPLKGAGLSVVFYMIPQLVAAFMLTVKLNQGKTPGFLKILPGIGAALLLMIFIFSPKTRILPPSFTRFDREIIEYRETTEGTWVVGREPGGKGAALSTYVNNSAVIGSSYDAIKVVKMVGHLPFYTGLQCKNVLVVGFGIGVTTSAIASHPEVERIDCIELVAGLKDAAHYYSGLNNNIQNDRRLKIIEGDGRHYLQATAKKYDLISSDPTHPILGSGSLYAKEYFELCKSRLNPGGMVSQYLPLHKLLPDDFLGIIKTFYSVFPGATVWLGQSHAVLLGAGEPFKVDFEDWTKNITGSVKDPYFYNNPYHLAACLILDSNAIAAFPEYIRINTDNKPLTEFFRLSSFDNGNMILNLNFLDENRTHTGSLFTNIPDSLMLQRFVNGNKLFARGVAADLEGNRRELIAKLREASQVNPENEEYPFLIKFYGGR
ncbi:MAG: fused MFS/spermidine synthase [Lentimicrobium sp.]|nr:fused MFS/spermidine synthase [Lentimicrobium sp.]